jgi:6-phosphogluconolactonase
MPSATARTLATFLILAALLALEGCSGKATFTACPVDTSSCGPISAPQYLYATGLSGQVTSFPVESGGGLGSATNTTGPAATFGMTALNNQFLYVSNPQPSNRDSAINAWSIDSSTGLLTTVPGSPFALGQFSLAAGLAASNNILYVADDGRVDALQANASGALNAISGSPFNSGINLYLTVDPQSRFLFTSDEDPPGGVFAFTIDSTSGALTAVQGSPFAAIPNSSTNTLPGEIVVDSSGSFVYLTLTTTDQVAAFSISAPAGTLTPVPGSPFAAGSRPLALATANKFLYVSNTAGGTISGYMIDSTSGALTPVSGSPFQIIAAALATDPLGNFLYASNPVGILVFSIDPSTGALNQIVGSPFPSPGATVLTFVGP